MATTYPKMKTGTAVDSVGTSHAVPIVFPIGHVKAGAYVIFNSAAEENSYDGTGVATSTNSNYWENKHH